MRGAMLLRISVLLISYFLLIQSQLVSAAIKDGIPCSNCHTMHNSQDGVALTEATTEALLKVTCSGCHTGTNATVGSGNAPYVLDVSGAGPTYGNTGTSGHNTLAGGNFFWVQDTTDINSDRKGHNVRGIARDDQLFGTAGTQPVPGTITNLANQLTCSGSTGCHGSGVGGEFDSLMPAHHVADVTPLTGASVALSYRFLSGIIGLEDSDWEFTVDSADHNQYKGSTNYNEDYSAATETITSVCVGCHGYFHGQYSGVAGEGGTSLNGLSPWVRHPSDIDIADAQYNGTVYGNYITYDPVAPVASSSGLTLVNTAVQTPGNGIVTCITCHRAHGTPYDAMLRWDYKNWPACSPNCDGCQICHSDKD